MTEQSTCLPAAPVDPSSAASAANPGTTRLKRRLRHSREQGCREVVRGDFTTNWLAAVALQAD